MTIIPVLLSPSRHEPNMAGSERRWLGCELTYYYHPLEAEVPQMSRTGNGGK